MKTKLMVALALTAVASLAQARGIPRDIHFDGLCDGLTGLTQNSNGSGVYGYRVNINCNPDFPQILVVGVIGAARGGVRNAYIMGTTGLAAYVGVELTYVVNPDHTWSSYFLDGSVYSSGTWTAGAPPAHSQATKSSSPDRR